MHVIFNVQDVAEYVDNGYTPLEADPTPEQRAAFKERKKQDQKALLYIHQCADSKIFEKTSE